MKTLNTTTYQCEVCGEMYSSQAEAMICESQPLREDKGVQVGDTVRITAGDGAGQLAVVTHRYVLNKDWGHYQYARYWHTVAVNADIKGSGWSRMLTFDQYEKV